MSAASVGLVVGCILTVGSISCGQRSTPGIDAKIDEPSVGLPVRHRWNPTQALRGQGLLQGGLNKRALLPKLALRNLWIVWGDSSAGTDSAYWQAFGMRYGLSPAPYSNRIDGSTSVDYPMGIVAVDASSATFDCMICHGSVVAGKSVIGVGNSLIDLQGLYDDLVELNRLAPRFGFPSFPIPFTLTNQTGAAGSSDAMGLGMGLAIRNDPRRPMLNTTYGFAQAPAWWTQKFRDQQYTDGSGLLWREASQTFGGHRTMMATLLAFGYSLAELQSMESEFADIGQAILATPAPKWTLTTIDPARRTAGQEVFRTQCASCHGFYEGDDAGFQDVIVPTTQLGTDPLRATQFTQAEAAWINQSWFGEDHPLQATAGYLSPPLTSVWATAPYFHNGSVPNLRSVIDSRLRPAVWQRTGSSTSDYDPSLVGWKYTTPIAPSNRASIVSRRVYDTSVPGLSNSGHTYGDALSDTQRDALLEYLRTL